MSKTLAVCSPHDGTVLQELPVTSTAEVESALAVASEAFRKRDAWLPAYRRIEILENFATLLHREREKLIRIAVSEGGKPWKDTAVEVDRAINGVKLGVAAFHQVRGMQIPMGLTSASVNRSACTFREPRGVVVSLSAFNHPVNLIVHQTVPAIVAGCPFLVKPARKTPLSGLALMDLLREAGLPEEWGQAIVCDRESTEKLVSDPRTAFLSFIGSAQVGWKLRSQLSPGTHCALEHGGAAPVIIDKCAELNDALIEGLVKGAYYHAGQVCVSVQRVYVPEDMSSEFVYKFCEAVKKLKTGNPAEKDTDVGPLIEHRETERVATWVEEACSSGAELICGGQKINKAYYSPTILLHPSVEAKVSSQELFGPVCCVYTYREVDEALKMANAVPFSFQASVYSSDIDRAHRIASRLKACAVMINDHTAFRVDWMPFGGEERSGLGVGGIEYSVRDMSYEKLFVFKTQSIERF